MYPNRNDFSQFDQCASTVLEASKFYAFNVIQTFETMADSITHQALRNREEFPLVTVEDFETKAAHARLTTFTETVFYVPYVYRKQREEWESYAQNSTWWLEESLTYKNETRKWLERQKFFAPDLSQDIQHPTSSVYNHDSLTVGEHSIAREIFTVSQENGSCQQACDLVPEPTRSFYAPIWQVSPPPTIPTAVNYNLISDSTIGEFSLSSRLHLLELTL